MCSIRRRSNGALISDLTPPDLVADIYDKLSIGSDKKCSDKVITD